jgi:hypothetical protein
MQEYNTILNWFTKSDHGVQLRENLRHRAPKTGSWFLESPAFKKWLAGTREMLFCPGIPGAGKTMIASIMVDHLHRIFREDGSVGVAFAFLDYQAKVSYPDLLLGFLKQLIPNPVPVTILELYEYHNEKGSHPDVSEIFATLCKIIQHYSKTFIVIDALDEIPTSNGIRSKIIKELFKIQEAVCVNIAVTSRPIPGIVERFEKRSIQRDIRASDDDVRRFIASEMLNFEPPIRDADGLERKITDTIMRATDGM